MGSFARVSNCGSFLRPCLTRSFTTLSPRLSATKRIEHPTIGTLHVGAGKQNVLQFLGLQYATLKDPFAPARQRQYASGEIVEATKLGPQTLTFPDNLEFELSLIQHDLEFDHSSLRQSATDGLNLSITVPTYGDGLTLDSSAKIPVLVMIHGGGFMSGSGVYPQYDMERLVRLSVQRGRPVIGVIFNYRLGAPGLLTSHALREAGYQMNNTLRDQRVALSWLRSHVEGFGGDPENITVIGESAGAVSVNSHLASHEPLFRRGILMGGSCLSFVPFSTEKAEREYANALAALDLTDKHPAEQVKALVAASSETDFVAKLATAGVQTLPVIDGDLCKTWYRPVDLLSGETKFAGSKWCEAVMIGDCQFDGFISEILLHKYRQDVAGFCRALKRELCDRPQIADRLLTAYNLSADVNDNNAFVRLLELCNDLDFYVPTRVLAQHFQSFAGKTKVFSYRFNEPNPWEGPWKGYATHVLDVAFLTQNFNEFLDDRQRANAEAFAEDVVRFAYGEEPWPAANQAKFYGPHGECGIVEDEPELTGRRRVLLALAEDDTFGYEALSVASVAIRKVAEG